MSRATSPTFAPAPAARRPVATSAPLPTITLLLTTGSLALPPRNHCSG
jgi:hypothetical protein